MFRGINAHYAALDQELSIEGYTRAQRSNTVLLLIPRVHRGILQAIDYSRGISGDVRGLHIATDDRDLTPLKEDWERFASDLPLVVLHSPYRSIISPLLAYLNEVDMERPDAYITVVVPECVTGRWWHGMLHAQYGAWIKLYLLRRRNVVVTNVRYFAYRESPRAPIQPAVAESPDVVASVPPLDDVRT
jgi:hypothetical protein